jgi:hypothetical protein
MVLSEVACVTLDSKELDSKEADCSIEVTDMLPDGLADTTRPELSATLSSKCGNDIDIESVEILLNDEVVPSKVTGRGAKVSVKCVPDWSLAQSSDHYVMVRAKDKEGNTVEEEWSFWLGLIY